MEDQKRNYLDYLVIGGKVMKDKIWYGLWNFDLFEKVDRCYATESYYNNFSSLLCDDPSRIIDNIYVGSAFNAADYKWLKSNKIDIIINVAPGISNFYLDEFEYHNINVEDLNNASMAPHFGKFLRLVKENPDKNIFVHCFAGKSRSVSLILYYLIKEKNMELEEAINLLKSIRPTININCTFIEEIQNE